MKKSKPASIKSGKTKNQQASKKTADKTSKHDAKAYIKPASISKHARAVGKLGGRPRGS